MSREIQLELLESAVSVTAALLEQQAPQTCDEMWEALKKPMESKILHGIWTGRTLEINIPGGNRSFDPESIPLENATTTPVPGDILWEYIPKGIIRSVDTALWNIMIAYGPESIMRTPLGPQPCNVWAIISSKNKEKFFKECAKQWFGEAQKIRIERVTA